MELINVNTFLYKINNMTNELQSQAKRILGEIL